MKRVGPLLVLGLLRLLMVKSTDYPEHVTEYGVHWNFFLTMSVLLLCTDLVQRFITKNVEWVLLGLAISLLHQVTLSCSHLGVWAMSEERNSESWISLNKEGIVSLPGMYAASITPRLLGHSLGRSSCWVQITIVFRIQAPDGATVPSRSRLAGTGARAVVRIRCKSSYGAYRYLIPGQLSLCPMVHRIQCHISSGFSSNRTDADEGHTMSSQPFRDDQSTLPDGIPSGMLFILRHSRIS